jgi:hypothetical protein
LFGIGFEAFFFLVITSSSWSSSPYAILAFSDVNLGIGMQ